MKKQTEVKDGVQSVVIRPPNFKVATFEIEGDAPLVVHRFSAKAAKAIEDKMTGGKPAASKKNREAVVPEDVFNEARYRSKEGWDGFHAGAIRSAMISACRLVGFKMTLAKLSVFVIADGWDATEPQIPLIRILGCDPVMQKDVPRVETGQPYVTWRPAYHGWKAKIKIRWDADQFTLADVTNLLARVGAQVGICEGRPDSKNSAGCGWGTFVVTGAK